MMVEPLVYGSVCSGIEAASVAWEPLGWTPAFFAEIEPFPCNVLAQRWGANLPGEPVPAGGVPNLGDMTRIDGAAWRGRIDVLVGGTPCQSFSIAGLRKGLRDGRGNLTLAFVELVHAIDPEFVVWENVDGVLSSTDNAFGIFLAGLVGADTAFQRPRGGWTVAGLVAGPERAAAWVVKDAQHFGVPQRRRRVFVASTRSRDGINPGAILFEPEGVRRNPAARGKAREDVAGTLGAGSGGRDASDAANHHLIPMVTGCLSASLGGADENDAADGRLIVQAFGGNNTAGTIEVATAVTAHGGPCGRQDFESETFIVYQCHGGSVGPLGTLKGKGDFGSGVPFTVLRTSGNCGAWDTGDVVDALTTGTDRTSHLVAGLGVRRLMPVECERLQGFPDGYTDVPVRRWIKERRLKDCTIRPGRWSERVKAASDGPRYKAIGNSKAVPVVRWIGERIALVRAAHRVRRGGA